MKSSKHKRKRILLHFFLGIGLPSLLLGYLAFRGIQNDQALLEKQRLNEHRRIAELITKSIDEHLLEVEQAFLDHFANHREVQYAALLRSLDSLKNQHPLIEEVFFLENSVQIQLPIARLLFFSDGSGQAFSTQAPPSALLKKIQIAQQYEFQQKRYQKAVASYQRVSTQVSNHQAKGELLNAIARVQKKSTQFRDAIKSYKTIAQDFSQTRMASGMPLGLAAHLELGSLFLAIHDSLSALQTFIGLYDKLIHREWALAKSQYDFFTHQVKEAIDENFSQASLPASMQSYQNTFTMLKGEEKIGDFPGVSCSWFKRRNSI